MQDKTSTKTTGKENPISEMAQQAVKNCEQALRSGLKLQEEAAHWMTNMFDPAAPADEWQKRMSSFTHLASGLKPVTQKRTEEMLDLVEKNTRSLTETQAKWLDFWTASLGAARSNAEALTHINARAMESWIEFMQKNAELSQARVPRAA